MNIHELKITRKNFLNLRDGRKRVEIRKDDRRPRFAVGDLLVLNEVCDKLTTGLEEHGLIPTGRCEIRRITHITCDQGDGAGAEGLDLGYVALSMEPIETSAHEDDGTIDLTGMTKGDSWFIPARALTADEMNRLSSPTPGPDRGKPLDLDGRRRGQPVRDGQRDANLDHRRRATPADRHGERNRSAGRPARTARRPPRRLPMKRRRPYDAPAIVWTYRIADKPIEALGRIRVGLEDMALAASAADRAARQLRSALDSYDAATGKRAR